MDGGDWLAVGGSVLGAIIGPLVASRLPSSSNQGITVTNSPGARVTANSKIKIDKRQVTRITIKSESTPKVDPPSTSRRPSQRQTDEDDTWTYLILTFIAIILLVAGYLRYRHEVYGVVVAIQLFGAISAFSALITTRIRSVVFGPWIATQIFLNIAMAIVAILSVFWLTNPPFGAPETFQPFLDDGAKLSVTALMKQYGLDAFLFTAYQLLGLLISLLTVALILLHSLKLLFISEVIARQRTDPSYALGKIRQWFITGLNGGTALPFVMAFIFTVFSLVLTSGLGYAFVSENAIFEPIAETTTAMLFTKPVPNITL